MSEFLRFRRNRGALLALLIFACSGCGRAGVAVPGAHDMVLMTKDGVRLAATLYPAKTTPTPGLIFVHMLGGKRSDWDPLAQLAQRQGFMCITFDLRGHGGSANQNGHPITYRNFSNEDWLGATQDIAAAKRALVANGAQRDDLGVIGAGIGASLALRYGASDPDIAAAVLISPSLNDHGFNTERDLIAFGKRPVLLVTAEDDSYSAGACATLKRHAPGFCELRSYAGSAHGTDLLATSPNATNLIVQWLIPILKSTKPPVPLGP